jgi:hypothetical protein
MSAGYMSKCARKIRFGNKVAALAARTVRVRAGDWRMNETATYRCDQCGGWHNGHTGRVRRRGKK